MLLMDMMVVVPYEDIFEPLEGLVMFCILILCCVRQENQPAPANRFHSPFSQPLMFLRGINVGVMKRPGGAITSRKAKRSNVLLFFKQTVPKKVYTYIYILSSLLARNFIQCKMGGRAARQVYIFNCSQTALIPIMYILFPFSKYVS